MNGLHRWLARCVGLGILIVLGLSAVIIHYGSVDRAHKADVIIVLGGGDAGTERRTRHAAALYHQGYAPIILCSGGKGAAAAISEAQRCARRATRLGVPADAIVWETNSLSTEENAMAVARLMDERGWQDAVLVSDDFHLWRAHWMFNKYGVRCWPSPAQVTVRSMNLHDKSDAVLREIVATGWYVTKTVLGLDSTRVGD